MSRKIYLILLFILLAGCGSKKHRLAAVNAESLGAEIKMICKQQPDEADKIKQAFGVLSIVYLSQVDTERDAVAKFRGKTGRDLIEEVNALDDATRLTASSQFDQAKSTAIELSRANGGQE